MKTNNNQQNAQKNSKNAAMKQNLLVFGANSHNGWFENEVRKQKEDYDELIRKGMKDIGYLWSSLFLEIFLEGVFTLRVVPCQIEVNIPKGKFRLTAVHREGNVAWVIRNDTFGSLVEVYPSQLFEWAHTTCPQGIGIEGYRYLAWVLLTAGCEDEKEKHRIWDATFIHNGDGRFA